MKKHTRNCPLQCKCEFYAARPFDMMKKPIDKTLGIVAEIEDVIYMLKTEITISDSHKKEKLQNAISTLDKAANLVLGVFIMLEGYEDQR